MTRLWRDDAVRTPEGLLGVLLEVGDGVMVAHLGGLWEGDRSALVEAADPSPSEAADLLEIHAGLWALTTRLDPGQLARAMQLVERVKRLVEAAAPDPEAALRACRHARRLSDRVVELVAPLRGLA